MNIENLIEQLQHIQIKNPGIRVFGFDDTPPNQEFRLRLRPPRLNIYSEKRRPDYLEYAKKNLLGIFSETTDKFLLL